MFKNDPWAPISPVGGQGHQGQPTSGYPQQVGQYPQQENPSGVHPQQGHPGGVHPQQGNPTGAYPQQLNPTQVYPQQDLSSASPYGVIYEKEEPRRGMTLNGDDPSLMLDFSESTIRLKFIRKVYSILTVQILVVIAFIALFVFDEGVNNYFRVHYEFLLVALVAVLVLVIMMSCFAHVRRTAPMNYICLFLFTFCWSFLLGAFAACYDAQEVLLAMAMTAGITLGLTLFAFQTRLDFTMLGGALFALLLVLVIGGLFAFSYPDRALQTAFAGFGAVLSSLYIIYDTQLMLGGEHKYTISPEEYVFAALNLYIDIIRLFRYILRFMG